MNKQWEYLNFVVKSEDLTFLNELGELGWEAYAVKGLLGGESIYHLKREK